MNIPYQSQASQDKFVAKILNYKRDGYYLDIGSCDAVSTNNSYAFESLGWKGICIEFDSSHNDSYKARNCKHINDDATKIDYIRLLEENNAPIMIDYLSLDIDALSTEVLKKLPLDKYIFSVITIEHDQYIHGGIFRDEQRRILTDAGYVLYCGDVLVPLQSDTKPDTSFEDWWLHKSMLPKPTMNTRMYPTEILVRLG